MQPNQWIGNGKAIIHLCMKYTACGFAIVVIQLFLVCFAVCWFLLLLTMCKCVYVCFSSVNVQHTRVYTLLHYSEQQQCVSIQSMHSGLLGTYFRTFEDIFQNIPPSTIFIVLAKRERTTDISILTYNHILQKCMIETLLFQLECRPWFVSIGFETTMCFYMYMKFYTFRTFDIQYISMSTNLFKFDEKT